MCFVALLEVARSWYLLVAML